MRTATSIIIIVIIGATLAVVLLRQAAQAPTIPNESILAHEGSSPTMTTLAISSPAFNPGGLIPPKYTCDADNISPRIEIHDVPDGTQSLALIMVDPDIPDSVKKSRDVDEYVHWIAFNIPPETQAIEEGQEPRGVVGWNSSVRLGYTGPCPPDREHRYFFRLYALDTLFDLPEDRRSQQDLEQAMEGHILAKGELVGRYDRQR